MMKALRYTGFIMLLIFFPAFGMWAQENDVIRLELNARMTEDTYVAIPCGEKGVVVFYEGGLDEETEERSWYFALFDEQLVESWIKIIGLSDGMSFYDYQVNSPQLYMLFHNRGRVKSGEPDYQVLQLNTDNGIYKITNGQLADKAMPAGFLVKENKAFTGFNFRKNNAELSYVDLGTGVGKMIPMNFGEQNLIDNIYSDTLRNSIYILTKVYNNKQLSTLIFSTFSPSGELKETTEIKAVLEGKFLNTAEILSWDDAIYALGTYNSFSARLPDEDEIDLSESAGFYITKFENGKQKFINYFNFLEFEELYNSLSGRDIMKIRKSVEKEKDKDKISEYSLNYNLLLHPVSVSKDRFILMAEAFSAEYRTVTDMSYDYYGRMIPQTYTVFDGFKFFNTIAACFDLEGNLLWDQDMEVWNLVTYDLRPYMRLHVKNDEVAMFFNWQSQLNYKVFDQVNYYEDSDHLDLALKYKRDKLVDETDSQIRHWYDDYFLCTGYQEIKNNNLAKGKRTVFYLQKVAFQ